MELSPPAFRTFVVGTSYQLGNLVSSASSTIEATIGERFPLAPKISGGKATKRYQYGKVICIFLGCVGSPASLYAFAPIPGFRTMIGG
jgi:SHS family lactate transporter-like MFS transporter